MFKFIYAIIDLNIFKYLIFGDKQNLKSCSSKHEGAV